jgi:hypothetical protein
MSETTSYTPPKVWTWDSSSGGQFASINRPIAGATFDAELARMPTERLEGALQDDRGGPLTSMRIQALRDALGTEASS